MSLHVPSGYRPGTERRFPLVVVLHGLGGNAERVMTSFLGTDSRKPHARVDGFVLAPHAHGDAFYRGPGETEVLDAIDWALATYPIDPERVSITGISMGGTGAAHFGLRYPDRFAAAAALAGYHSFFVRRDIRGKRLRPWERTELMRWSPASWAENGRDLFLYIAQGTKDLPLEHSLSLADRYRSLGYSFTDEWPDIGHDVWRIVWGNADLWPVLASKRATTSAPRVVVKTDSLRYGTNRWASVTALESSLVTAKLDAHAVGPQRIIVKTSGVEALELRRPSRSANPASKITVELDGTHLDFGNAEPFAAHREGSSWTVGPLPENHDLAKRAGVEGPIRDAFAGPLAFVYGTLDPSQTRAAREVAEHFRSRWSGSTRFPVLPDTDVDADLVLTHSLFLVGSRASNRVVRDIDPQLPFGIDGTSVRAGSARVVGDPELGFACVYPNPRSSSRYVVLLEAVNARGLYRALSLPLQLPDFIVFDSGLAPAAAGQILADARVLGAGYFDRNWGVPARFVDETLPPEHESRAPAGTAAGAAPRTPVSAGEAQPR
jgi:predicted esterase